MQQIAKSNQSPNFFFFGGGGRKGSVKKRHRYILQDEDQFEKIPQYLLPRALLIFKNLE